MNMIPLSIPNFCGNEKKYVDDAIEQGWVSTGGTYINKLEKELARYLHVNNVAACQSGTSAIHLSLVEAGVEPGDAVIVPTLTFIAAVNPVKYQFASPIFMDCDDSFCIDPVKLADFCETECVFDGEKLVYHGKTVKALIVVHIFGNMADMVSILETAHRYNIVVIEDATEALGTKYTEGPYEGMYAGTIGDFGAYSFNANKIITTGGGGAVTANNCESVEHIRYLSTQAKDDPGFYIHNEVGYNYRMTNLQAALGLAQLENLPDFICCKQKNYDYYLKLFKYFNFASLVQFKSCISSNKWFYSLEIDMSRMGVTLKEIIGELQKRGVQTRAIWGLINEQKPYLNEKTYKLDKASYYAGRVINIPCSTQLSYKEIEYVAKQIKDVLEEVAIE